MEHQPSTATSLVVSAPRPRRVRRYHFLTIGLTLLLLSGAATLSSLIPTGSHAQAASPRENAYAFLDQMMDAYASGSTLRLETSYSDQLGLPAVGFTYDNALAIIAYTQDEGDGGLRRAKLLGNALLYAQQHDPIGDGRLRQAYYNTPFILSDGTPNLVLAPFYFIGTAVGDMAWAGMALGWLAHETGDKSYLQGAVKIGTWIYANTYDTRGAGGYNFGVDAGNNKLLYKSTEHNIDTYAFFTMLARLTHDKTWTSRAAWALGFVHAMWNSSGGFFWTGTGADGATINTSVLPEDVNTWSWLALRDPAYAQSIEWAQQNLAAVDGPYTGVSYSNADTSGVWFEGTGHLAAALFDRHGPGDVKAARALLATLELAQANLGANQTINGAPIPVGKGVVAASRALNTGFGFDYFPDLHVGATAWYLLAAERVNPFHLDDD